MGGAALMLVCALAACRGDQDRTAAPASAREQDSTLGASRLPGAQGIRGAIKVSDSAAARRLREDSASAAAP